MKIRNGFVSNSSSCSFTIDLISRTGITKEQLTLITGFAHYTYEQWYFVIENGKFIGRSSTGNGGIQMKRYLEELGIDENLITWEYD